MPADTPRRQPADVRRDQILDAAKSVLLQRGLPHTTIAEVAEAAGLGKGTVYLHFESKQDILAGLVQRHISHIEAEVRKAISLAHSPSTRLAAFVRSFATVSTARPDLHHLFFQDALMNEAEAFAPLRSLFAEMVTEAVPEQADAHLTIEYAFGGLHAALATLSHLPQRSRTRAINGIVDLVTRTVS